jgi:hypothetical protein
MFGSLAELKDPEPIGTKSVFAKQRLLKRECREKFTRFVTEKIGRPHDLGAVRTALVKVECMAVRGQIDRICLCERPGGKNPYEDQ